MLEHLSNESLIERFGKLVRTERKITHLVIAYIDEIERRKIYLDRAYPSLFEDLIKEFGYSESAAYRRIGAARLLRQVPEVTQKASVAPIANSLKLQILEMIENKSFQQSQQSVHRELGVEQRPTDRSHTNADGSITLTFTLSAEQAARWKRVGELGSHSVPPGNSADLLDDLAQKVFHWQSPFRSAIGWSRRAY